MFFDMEVSRLKAKYVYDFLIITLVYRKSKLLT